MKYKKIYEGNVILTTTSLTELLKNVPSDVKMEELKIIPVFNVLGSGGTELVGFRLVAYRQDGES
jgi:hypothetical protein